MSVPVRVLLVDDHAVVRAGYRALLEDSGQIEVVAEAADAAAACQAWGECRPDVTVMDISLPGGSGMAALRRIMARDGRARVLMFSMHEDAIFARHALQAGARGYISKSSAPEVLLDAVLAIAGGGDYLGANIAQALARVVVADPEQALHTLTGREFDVLRLSLEGRSVGEVAAALKLSRKSVANHRWMIKQKTGVDNFLQLLHLLLRQGVRLDLQPAAGDHALPAGAARAARSACRAGRDGSA